MRTVILLLFLLLVKNVVAQKQLSLEEFLFVVKTYHPVAKQANIEVQIAKAGITSARGAFDPTIQLNTARKEFDGIYYYDQQINELKIPTWYGIDVHAGTESLSGDRTWTTETKGNTSYVGFTVPLAKNLLMDKRRAALQTAKIFHQLSQQEQRAIVNDLLLDAAKAYWYWWEAEENIRLYKAAVQNAQQRFKMVKTASRLGDRPAIDTVEALTQVQSFEIKQIEAETNLMNARIALAAFLWTKEDNHYELPDDVLPQPGASVFVSLDELLQSSVNHPLLKQYKFKVDALRIERKLKFQSLLPVVNLKYNQLSKTHDVAKNFTTPWMQNSYRFGLGISVPLRLSEGRGGYQKAKLKIRQTELEQLNKAMQVQNKIKQQYNVWQQLQKQTQLQQRAIESFRQLQRGEEQKFFNGESSLFLINQREIKTIEAQQKLIELQSKAAGSLACLQWSAGLLQ